MNSRRIYDGWALFLCLTLCQWYASPNNAWAQNARVFVISKTPQGPTIESKDIADGETLIFDQPDVVTVVYTLGEGKSCDLIPAGIGRRVFQVTNHAGVLDIRVEQLGSKKSLPPMDTKSLDPTTIRVNIKTGDGNNAVFRISGYSQLARDDGPLVDMFGGKIPLQPADVSVTYETTKLIQTALSGSISANLEHGWLLADIQLPHGKSGKAVLDTAATTSVFGKQALSSNTQIHKLESVELTAAGEKRSAATMAAATGDVNQGGFLGKATLADVDCGGLQIPSLEFNVLESMPAELTELGIIGIIGLDVLSAGERLAIKRLTPNQYELTLGDGETIPSGHRTGTIQEAFGLRFFDGEIENQSVRLLLDTGARYSIIDELQWRKLKSPGTNLNAAQSISGLGGQKTQMERYRFKSFSFSNQSLENWESLVGPFKVFESLGLTDVAGICGMDTLKHFDSIWIDFVNHKFGVTELSNKQIP